MERFEMSFKNKRVRIWFSVILPITVLAILLTIFLPTEMQIVPTLLLMATLVVYYAWVFMSQRKNKG
ncbi:hypothetical protein [Planococcus glaciei]|uniref:Uncharacterized protein n=1 Tax=Planococcus glaciei TaxID=459472 RepID=A0A1G8HHE5_9BACL|nr:hypothetical protein [Planococcus glaciei]MCP2034772.1 membrane protein implicated in regulation of membrane protease activity [Planomicrobium sp. HSC-17F08]ETP67987.1 hypothetical protein G159_14325 [Planococcus glaciei CHR43]MBX0314794.1 hypothetical protein [Planococcus glaciei]QDY46421.1 hypothetical protein FK545_16865 [Planococcus glaciei]QKX51988.1 hypothetical protein HF394_16170 [Planococcus glaciei]